VGGVGVAVTTLLLKVANAEAVGVANAIAVACGFIVVGKGAIVGAAVA